MRSKVNIRPLLLILLSLWVIIPHNWGHDHDHYYFEKEELHCALNIGSDAVAGGVVIPPHSHLREHEAHCHWCDYVPSFIGVNSPEQITEMLQGEPLRFYSGEMPLPGSFPVEAKGRGPPVERIA